MKKVSVRDLEWAGRRVLCRVDFNVPLRDGKVADDTRIRAALPTLRLLRDQGAAIILMSHLGRPAGMVKPEFSLRPVAAELATLLECDVDFASDCVGTEAERKAAALKPGQVLLLENLRFHPEEEGKVKLPESASQEETAAVKQRMKAQQKDFARRLAALGDAYVNDAFGTAHRAHASTAIITEFLSPCAAGLLLQKELEYLGGVLADPRRPLVAILGGAKVSDKILVIRNLLGKVDRLLIGGGMAYTFYRAKGLPIGKSLVEEDAVDLARELLALAQERGVELQLPVDHVVADRFAADAEHRVVGAADIPGDWMALDIGPETARRFAEVIAAAGSVLWNGPMGCFEMEPFASGTFAVARALAEADCVSIVGGGDSASAVMKSGVADRITHISTGGGASLELIEGKELPGVAVLPDT